MARPPHCMQTASSLLTRSASAKSGAIILKELPRRSVSRPAAIIRRPVVVRSRMNGIRSSEKN